MFMKTALNDTIINFLCSTLVIKCSLNSFVFVCSVLNHYLYKPTHLVHFPRGRKWQHGDSDEQIGHRQADNEKVGHAAQFVRTEDGRNHEAIADDDQHVDEQQHAERKELPRVRPLHVVVVRAVRPRPSAHSARALTSARETRRPRSVVTQPHLAPQRQVEYKAAHTLV